MISEDYETRDSLELIQKRIEFFKKSVAKDQDSLKELEDLELAELDRIYCKKHHRTPELEDCIHCAG